MARQRIMVESSSGGSAAAGGMDYQHRVSAWAAVQMLAEKASTVPWNLGTETLFELFRCETEQPIDDLFVETSSQGRIFVQVKHTVYLSKRDDSDLASVLDQFVRQFITCRSGTTGIQPLTLADTARKLKISFYAYIQDRISGTNQIPSLATLVTQRARELNLGSSWA